MGSPVLWFGASSFVSSSELPSSCRWGWAGGTRPDLLCSSPSPVGGPCAPRLRPSGSGPGRSLPARGCFLRGGGGSGRPARPPQPSSGDRGPSAGLVLGECFQELPGWHLVGPLWPLLPQLPGQRSPTPLRGSLRPHLGLAHFSALGGQGDGVWLAQGLGPGQGGEHGRPRQPLQATCPVSSCEALHVWFGPVGMPERQSRLPSGDRVPGSGCGPRTQARLGVGGRVEGSPPTPRGRLLWRVRLAAARG